MKLITAAFFIPYLFGSLFFSSCNGQASASNTIKQGKHKIIPDSKAIVIYKDTKGHLWLSDQEKGVYQYDGEHFTLLSTNNGLENYRVLSIQEDSFGHLYFDTPDAIYQFNGTNFKKFI